MPAGAVGSCWAAGSWSDLAWEANAWGSAVLPPIEVPELPVPPITWPDLPPSPQPAFPPRPDPIFSPPASGGVRLFHPTPAHEKHAPRGRITASVTLHGVVGQVAAVGDLVWPPPITIEADVRLDSPCGVVQIRGRVPDDAIALFLLG